MLKDSYLITATQQRFYCKYCTDTFSAQIFYPKKNCYISTPLKFTISIDLKWKILTKDIDQYYFVSFKLIDQVLDTLFKASYHREYATSQNRYGLDRNIFTHLLTADSNFRESYDSYQNAWI